MLLSFPHGLLGCGKVLVGICRCILGPYERKFGPLFLDQARALNYDHERYAAARNSTHTIRPIPNKTPYWDNIPLLAPTDHPHATLQQKTRYCHSVTAYTELLANGPAETYRNLD